MTVRTKLQQFASKLFTPDSSSQPMTIQSEQTVMAPIRVRPNSSPAAHALTQPEVISIPQQTVRQGSSVPLSQLLRIGSFIHPLCRHSFVEQSICSPYAYSRRHVNYRTSALAASYVGAYGPHAIKEAEFSYSMAVWRMSRVVGYDITKLIVEGPTGRINSVADEMIQLTDEDYWTREGVAEWLESVGL